jgi:hypothetical protein
MTASPHAGLRRVALQWFQIFQSIGWRVAASTLGSWALKIGLPALIVYGVILGLFGAIGVSPSTIIRDPAQMTDQPVYLGLLSNVGVFLWMATGAICLFSASLAGAASWASRSAQLLLFAGAFSILLGLDDFFLIHDRLLSDKVCVPIYLALGLTLVLRHARELATLEVLVMFVAVSFLAASVGIDVVQHHLPLKYETVQVIEDGCKFIGIISWLRFWAVGGATIVRAGR